MYLFYLVHIPFQIRANLKPRAAWSSFVQLSFGKVQGQKLHSFSGWPVPELCPSVWFFPPPHISNPFLALCKACCSCTYIRCIGKGVGVCKSGHNALDVSLWLLNREKQLLCSTCKLKPSNFVGIHHRECTLQTYVWLFNKLSTKLLLSHSVPGQQCCTDCALYRLQDFVFSYVQFYEAPVSHSSNLSRGFWMTAFPFSFTAPSSLVSSVNLIRVELWFIMQVVNENVK